MRTRLHDNGLRSKSRWTEQSPGTNQFLLALYEAGCHKNRRSKMFDRCTSRATFPHISIGDGRRAAALGLWGVGRCRSCRAWERCAACEPLLLMPSVLMQDGGVARVVKDINAVRDSCGTAWKPETKAGNGRTRLLIRVYKRPDPDQRISSLDASQNPIMLTYVAECC